MNSPSCSRTWMKRAPSASPSVSASPSTRLSSWKAKKCSDRNDLIARLGGDEFAILLENVDEAGAIRIAERIRESIHAAFKLESKEVFTTASIGIVPGSSGYRTPTEILRDADTSFQC